MSDNDDALVDNESFRRLAESVRRRATDGPVTVAESFIPTMNDRIESLTTELDKWRKIAGDALALLDKCFDELGRMDDQYELRGQIMELEEAYRTGESE